MPPVVYPNPCNPCNPCGGRCNEDECHGFGVVETCVECVEVPQIFAIEMGVLDCCVNASGRHELDYTSSCDWESGTFTCGVDTYKWTLTISTSTTSTLSLVRTAGSGSLITLNYERATPWECLCFNLVAKTIDSDECEGSPNTVCVEPILDCPPCETGIAECWELVVAGVVDGTCSGPGSDCSIVNGVFKLRPRSPFFGCVFVDSDVGNVAICDLSASPPWNISFPGGSHVFLGSYDSVLYKIAVGDFDCNGPNIFTRIDPGFGRCTGHPSTLTIEPVDCE